MRINPDTNAVDLTVGLGANAQPYNYGDMTGSAVPAAPSTGTWIVVHDSGTENQSWEHAKITWTADVTPPGSAVTVTAASSSDDGATFSAPVEVSNNANFVVPDGQHLKISVELQRGSDDVSPTLYDLSVTTNAPPVASCQDVELSVDENCKACPELEDIDAGSYDPEGDDLSYEVELDCTAPGLYTVSLTVTDEAGLSDSCESEITVVDNMVPTVSCVPGPNPAGNIPSANNQDGFFTISAGDNCEDSILGDVTIKVIDEVSGTSYVGPWDPEGTNIKYVQAKGGRPDQKNGPGVVDYKIKGKDNKLMVVVTDGSGLQSQTYCMLRP